MQQPSTWQRSLDIALSARIKTSTNYQVARLARIEARKCGCQDMILLNQWGRAAEATAASSAAREPIGSLCALAQAPMRLCQAREAK